MPSEVGVVNEILRQKILHLQRLDNDYTDHGHSLKRL